MSEDRPDRAGDPGNGRVGERLAEARTARGLSVADVAEATRVPSRHIEAIEAGDHTNLPAPTYSAGFVKAYARLVGLDGQTLSEAFRREAGAGGSARKRPEPYEPADPARTPPRGLAILALLVAVIVGLGYLYWRGRQETAAQTSAAPPPAATIPTTSAPTTPAPLPASGPVTVAATGDVWLKIAQANGPTLYMGIMKQGERFEVPATAVEPVLTTGRPGMTRVTVGDRLVPPLGDPDRAVRDVSLKPDALLARITATPESQPPPGVPTPVENVADPG